MPEPPAWLGAAWPASARDEWARIWSQPVSQLWQADDGSASRYLVAWSRCYAFEEPPSAAHMGEMRQAASLLLLDVKSRRMARVDVDVHQPARDAETRAAIMSLLPRDDA